MIDFSILWVVHSAAALIYLTLIGVSLRKRGFRDLIGRYLIFYLGFSLIWAIVDIAGHFEGVKSFAEGFGLYCFYLLSIILFHLNVVFLRRKVFWYWWVFGILWAILGLVMDLNWVSVPDPFLLGDSLTVRRQFVVWGIVLTGWGVFMAGTVWRTVRTYRQEEILVTRNRVTYWLLGLVLVIGGDLLIVLQNPVFGVMLKTLGGIVLTIMAITPRLPDLKEAIRRVISTILTVLLELLIYTVGFVGLQVAFKDFSGYRPLTIGIGLALLLLIVFNPMLHWVQKWINTLLLGEQKDYSQILRGYSNSISNILDMKLLSTMIVELIGEIFDIEGGALYTVDSELGEDAERRYRLSGIRGADNVLTDPGLIPINGPVAKAFGKNRTTLTISEIELLPKYRTITGGERTWLKNQKMDLFVPIHAKNEWIGLLALGAKKSGTSYSKSDINLLEILADQTAVALQNARLVESLVRVNNEFRRAYSAMEEAHTKLERLDRTKSDFISISSHELRTPLTVLSGYSQMLLDDPNLSSNQYYKKVIQGIYEGTSRLHEIVDSMLEVAKIDTRALELQSEPVKMSNLVQQVGSSFSNALVDRDLTMKIEIDADLPRVLGDPEALQKVFYHLVSNAIKYTPDGGEITISGTQILAGNRDFSPGGIQIVVSDTGIGIDPRFKELIFSKFYQTGELALHSSGKTKFKGGGPGLGLAIVRGIVMAHGGRVWVESEGYDEERNPGSKFHVILPIKPIRQDDGESETENLTP